MSNIIQRDVNTGACLTQQRSNNVSRKLIMRESERESERLKSGSFYNLQTRLGVMRNCHDMSCTPSCVMNTGSGDCYEAATLPGQFEVVSIRQHCNQYYDPPRAAIFVNYIHFYERS